MTLEQILSNLWTALGEIFKSMFRDPSIWWFLAPIILFWIILEIYFSEYKEEKLGWNTALGNGLSAFWILTVCMKYLFEDHMKNFELSKFIALILILGYAVFIIINSFSHKLKEKVSFLLASPTITYYLSGTAILWTYGQLKITIWVLIDLILLYGLILLIELILKKSIKGKNFAKQNSLKETDFSKDLGGFSRGL